MKYSITTALFFVSAQCTAKNIDYFKLFIIHEYAEIRVGEVRSCERTPTPSCRSAFTFRIPYGDGIAVTGVWSAHNLIADDRVAHVIKTRIDSPE